MGAFVALLRGINVGGANRVAMADLRALAADLGFARPRTLLQSGNLVFDAPGEAAEAIEARLESTVADRLGVASEVVVRAADDWADLIAVNPLPGPAAADPGHLLVVALKARPDGDAEMRLRTACPGPEIIRVVGRQAYIHYTEGVGRSKLTTAVVDKALGVRGTARNWNTVVKIADLLAG